MKTRTRKVLSLILAASMVFTMNTIAFAEEVVEVAADSEVAVEAEADNDAVVDEAVVDDAGTDDTGNTTEGDGIIYVDGKPKTTIAYGSNGDKKNAKNNVVTITNTTDPVSWNNFYGTDLIATVLYGSDAEDTWLNNTSTYSVSQARAYGRGTHTNVPGIYSSRLESYDVLDLGNSAYLFVGYGLAGGSLDYVNGQDTVETYMKNGSTAVTTTPVVEWDGRTINYNKSGLNKSTASSKEALNVKIALVTYANGTVTEVKGAEVGSVKIEKKNAKKASVKLTKTFKTAKLKYGETDYTLPYFAHDTMGDLPTFTITAKVAGSDVKSYKKAVKNALKDKKYTFGILQKEINIPENATTREYAFEPVAKNEILNWAVSYYTAKDNGQTGSKKQYTLSANDVKDKDGEGIEKDIADNLLKYDVFTDTDSDDVKFSNGALTMSKFNGKKGNLVLNVTTNNGKGKVGDATVSLKVKKDYTLETATVAGTEVLRLEFPDDSNYAYAVMGARAVNPEADKYEAEADYDNDLAQLGFSYAFRKSPVEKSKKFRYGVIGAENNIGFVYEQ